MNRNKMIRTIVATMLMLVYCGLNLYAQQKVANTITVKGEFDEKVNGNLNLTFKRVGGGKMEFDSARVTNGKFNFSRTSAEPLVLVMALELKKNEPGRGGSMNYNAFYLNPGEVNMSGSTDLKKTTVTGSGTEGNADYQHYSAAINVFLAKLSNSNRAVPASLPLEEKEKIWKKNADSINLIRDEEVFLKTIKEKPQSLLAVLALNQYASEPVWTPRKKMQPELIEKLLATLPAKYQAYPSLKSLKKELQVAKTTGVGQPMINFTLKDVNGKAVSLSDFKGKYVFLDFWASWCVPCRKENPNVKAQYLRYKDKGFTVLSVSMDKAADRKAWLDAIEKDGIGMWTHLVDEAGFAGFAAKSYDVMSIPTNFLISPDGKFVGRNLYGENLDKALKPLFQGK